MPAVLSPLPGLSRPTCSLYRREQI